MNKKTSVSLSEETRESIKKLAVSEHRTSSTVLDILVQASARVAEDAAQYGKTVKEIADEIEKIGKKFQRGGKKN
jgi:septation ring formation regulator EzrA